MVAFHLEALVAIALSLSILMAFAWVVLQRTGNSGWVAAIWTFSVGLVGAGSVLWPSAASTPNVRQCLITALVAIWSLRPRSRGERYREYQVRTSRFFPLPLQKGVVT